MSNIKLPAGFKAIAGGGGDSIKWKKGLVVTGNVLEIKTVQVRDLSSKKAGATKDARLMRINTKDGEVTIWEKAALHGLFESAKKGKVVWIRHEGFGKAKPGQSKPNLFTAAMK